MIARQFSRQPSVKKGSSDAEGRTPSELSEDVPEDSPEQAESKTTSAQDIIVGLARHLNIERLLLWGENYLQLPDEYFLHLIADTYQIAARLG